MATLTMDKASYDRIMDKLAKFGKIEQEGMVAQALKEGATIVKDESKSNIKSRLVKRSGNLIGSASVLVKKKDGKAYAGFKRPKGAHAHLLEAGTKERYTKTGAYRGKVKAYNFHKDAVTKKEGEVLRTVEESIMKSIEKITNRN